MIGVAYTIISITPRDISSVLLVPLAMLGLLLEPLELAGLGGSRPPEGCCLVRGFSLADRAEVGVHLSGHHDFQVRRRRYCQNLGHQVSTSVDGN